MSRPGDDNGFADWGGYMDAKITKLEEQFLAVGNSMRQSNLFAGISIFVNGLTNPSADELKRLMMVYGGVYHHYQRSHTTYIIAANLPDVKVRNMDTSKIISAQWVVDCIKENRIIDYTKYLLYTNHKKSQPKLIFQKKPPEVKKTEVASEAEILEELRILKEKMKQPIESTQGFDKPENNDSIKQSEESLHERKYSPSVEPLEDYNDETLSPEMFDDLPDVDDVQQPAQEIKVNESVINKTNSAKTAVDPNFLSEFYNNSRLHHIATLGAGFKQYVSELRENHDGTFPGKVTVEEKLKQLEDFKEYQRVIMHIDMDCFFVSVGLRKHPHLRGYPVAVTHSKGREANSRPGVDRQLEMELYMKRFGEKLNDNVKSEKIQKGFEGNDSLSEIASCSYEARKAGLRNGMFVGQALKLCPNLKTIPYDFEGYKEVANTLYNTVAKYSLNIEAVSCDEMYVDLTELLNSTRVSIMEFVSFLRSEVKELTGCPCSAGVGSNRIQARMATKKAKPDGQFYLENESVEEYMANIAAEDLPGVGYSTAHTLKQFKWETCGDLQQIPLNKLQKEFGKKFGETLYNFCRGVDNRPLVYGHVRKSVSAEVNYGIRFKEFEELEKFLRQLCGEVTNRLVDIKRRGKCITLKLMVRSKEAPIETSKFMGHGFCDYITKSSSLNEYTCDLNVITKTVFAILKPLNIPPNELRGIGIQITKLDDPNESKKPKNNVLKAMFSKVVEKKAEVKDDSMASSSSKQPASNIEMNKSPFKVSSAKSPLKKTVSTQRKSGRGRAKGGKSIKAESIGSLLQHAKSRKVDDKEEVIEGIDYDVLNELPEDIREEALRDHKRRMKTKQMNESTPIKESKKIKVDVEFLAALPPGLRKEVENEISLQNNKFVLTGSDKDTSITPTKSTAVSSVQKREVTNEQVHRLSEDNIIVQPNWRELLHAWLESSDSPEDFDIQMIAEHAKEIVRLKKINDLYVPLKYLSRMVSKKVVCSWHAAYSKILNAVQVEMMSTYGSKMFLEDSLICDKCNNK